MKRPPMLVYAEGNWHRIPAAIADKRMRLLAERLIQVAQALAIKQSVALARKTDRALRGL